MKCWKAIQGRGEEEIPHSSSFDVLWGTILQRSPFSWTFDILDRKFFIFKKKSGGQWLLFLFKSAACGPIHTSFPRTTHFGYIGESSIAVGRQSRQADVAVHPLGTAALDLAENSFFFKFQQHRKNIAEECFQTKCAIFPREQIIPNRYIHRITGRKESCSLYECNKSKGRCSCVSWKQVMNRRTGNQTASWKIPTTGCMQIPLPRSHDSTQPWFHTLVRQLCTLIKTENDLQILQGQAGQD